MLILISGNIGVGKTTLARLLAKKRGAICICFDDIVMQLHKQVYGSDDTFLLSVKETKAVYAKMHEEARKALLQGKEVILESMYFKEQREEAQILAKETKFLPLSVVCDEEIVKERLLNRKEKHPQTGGYKLYKQYEAIVRQEQMNLCIDTTHKTPEECVDEANNVIEKY